MAPARSKEHFFTPSFWDLHLHGLEGIDFIRVRTEDEMMHACETLAKKGIGYFAPTLLTEEPQTLFDSVQRWGRFLTRFHESPQYQPQRCAIPIGLHLEGPFLSPSMAGAHPKRFIRKPDSGLLTSLIRASQNQVAIVTLAPENKGALSLVSSLVRRGVRVQLGHTQASAEQALTAVKKGARGLTHLMNAMKIHHREPGLLAALHVPRVCAEIITDGHHVHPHYFWALFRAFSGQLYAVSDCCSGVSLGSLRLSSQRGLAYTRSGTIAGSTSPLTEHPARLKTKLATLPGFIDARKNIFELFYANQSGFFEKIRKKFPQPQLAFDSKTWKFKTL